MFRILSFYSITFYITYSVMCQRPISQKCWIPSWVKLNVFYVRNIKVIKTCSYKIVGIVVENIFRDQNLPRFITLIWVKIPESTRAEKMYCNFPLTSISFYGSYYDVLLHLIIFLSQYHHNMQQWIIILCFFCFSYLDILLPCNTIKNMCFISL